MYQAAAITIQVGGPEYVGRAVVGIGDGVGDPVVICPHNARPPCNPFVPSVQSFAFASTQ